MYKVQAFGKVILLACAVAVNVVVFSIVGMPWASGDPPINGGGDSSGGGGPPGGVADAPGGVSSADGLWSATVGGTEHARLGPSDVGSVLWRGNTVSRMVIGSDGVPRMTQVCNGFPEIVLESSDSGTMPGKGGAAVDLDLLNCTVTLSEVFRTSTGISDGTGNMGGPQSMLWNPRLGARSVPIAWRESHVPSSSPLVNPSAHGATRRTELTMRMKAGNPVGETLTQTRIVRSYRLDTRETISFRNDCDANSPAGWVGVHWREDSCTGGYSRSLGRASAWAQGRFHGDISRSAIRFNMSSRHTMNLLLEGAAHHEIRRCTVNPTSIEDLRVHFAIFSLGVRISCSYDSAIRS